MREDKCSGYELVEGFKVQTARGCGNTVRTPKTHVLVAGPTCGRLFKELRHDWVWAPSLRHAERGSEITLDYLIKSLILVDLSYDLHIDGKSLPMACTRA